MAHLPIRFGAKLGPSKATPGAVTTPPGGSTRTTPQHYLAQFEQRLNIQRAKAAKPAAKFTRLGPKVGTPMGKTPAEFAAQVLPGARHTSTRRGSDATQPTEYHFERDGFRIAVAHEEKEPLSATVTRSGEPSLKLRLNQDEWGNLERRTVVYKEGELFVQWIDWGSAKTTVTAELKTLEGSQTSITQDGRLIDQRIVGFRGEPLNLVLKAREGLASKGVPRDLLFEPMLGTTWDRATEAGQRLADALKEKVTVEHYEKTVILRPQKG